MKTEIFISKFIIKDWSINQCDAGDTIIVFSINIILSGQNIISLAVN